MTASVDGEGQVEELTKEGTDKKEKRRKKKEKRKKEKKEVKKKLDDTPSSSSFMAHPGPQTHEFYIFWLAYTLAHQSLSFSISPPHVL